MSKLRKPNELITIDDVSIHPLLISKLKKELRRVVRVSESEAKNIFEMTSCAVLKTKVIDAFSKFHDANLSGEKFAFECTNNENMKFDGIYTGTICEISGESGSGKTQLCLHLSIMAQVPQHIGGLSSRVVYIHSEGEFPIKRYMELTHGFKKMHALPSNFNLTDNLIIKKVYSLKEAMHVLQNGIPELLEQGTKPKLIIIDSVAALLRSEYDSLNLRTLMIQQFAIEMWNLANIHGMAVVCVNQVSGSVSDNQTAVCSTAVDVPSLGLLWSNILTTRMKISRKLSQVDPVIRKFEVVFSSYHPRISVDFIISSTGIKFNN